MSDVKLSPQEERNELLRMHASAERLAEQRRVEIRGLQEHIKALQQRLDGAQQEAYSALDACRKANDEVGQRNARIERLEAFGVSLTNVGRQLDAQAMNETAYRLWIACRDKDVSTDAITMIVGALRAAERRAPERAAGVVQWADEKAAIRALSGSVPIEVARARMQEGYERAAQCLELLREGAALVRELLATPTDVDRWTASTGPSRRQRLVEWLVGADRAVAP